MFDMRKEHIALHITIFEFESNRMLYHYNIRIIFVTLKGIKFRGYLISQLEKNYILRVFNFRIWLLQNISQVLILRFQ